MGAYEDQMNQALRPIAPPRLLEGVYTDDQYGRLLDVVKQKGPWPTIQAHHFKTVEELIATVTGVVPEGHGLTLDDIANPQFRGFYGQNSVCFHPEVHDCFYNPQFIELVKDYWNVQYAKPTMMLFNITGPYPAAAPPPAHLDAVTFRGVRYENAPVWLQNVMGKSGLFTDYLVKMAQVITWWYVGENGTFTYWPEGPLGPPEVLEHPLWNKGLVVQNELMFHRGDPVGPFDAPPVEGLKHRSMMGWDPEVDAWQITTDDEVIHTYQPSDLRFLVHWSSELYEDMDELKKVMDHTDDLTIEKAVGMLVDDMRSKGKKIAEPSDPLDDTDFVKALVETYTIGPATEWLEFPAA
ncbi:hypothetical protein [Rhabdothermincola salaria]|uniref:hypothetical protein n=1 Tax=Rhabdothermincola salaria TaxID=2903142 RepID=UPI001E6559EF|nr:hypothetical protein [Rhabdothermincola salaria]MCD9624308.1 hypothetical protein [Rhabdothermincola salaria]